MQANVRSTTSQFLKHLAPWVLERIFSTVPTAYVAVGLAASTALSVPRYILPIVEGSILLFTIRFNSAFAAIEAVSSFTSASAIYFRPNPFSSFAGIISLFSAKLTIGKAMFGK